MHCLICQGEGTITPAIGICVHCGAACCDRHGTMTITTRNVPTGNVVEQVPVETRAFTCETCLAMGAHVPARAWAQ